MRTSPGQSLRARIPVGALALGASVLLMASSSLMAACSSESVTFETSPERVAVVSGYGDLAEAAFTLSAGSAAVLRDQVIAFVEQPSQASLDATRTQWVNARNDYTVAEAFRFAGGPIDSQPENLEARISTWPIDEALIDYTVDEPAAGLINDPEGFPALDVEAIKSAAADGGVVPTGWHAIEFLLWGSDTDPAGPGARPVSDFTSADNADRRGTYLRSLSELLVVDLTTVAEGWKQGSATRAAFEADDSAALRNIVQGLSTLSGNEMANERLGVAYETKSEEDERSKFSDNTNADLRNTLLGIRGIYLGELAGRKVASLSGLVAAVDPDLDQRMQAELAMSVENASSMPSLFDQSVLGEDSSPGRSAIAAFIGSVETQAKTLVEVGGAIGVSVAVQTTLAT